MSGSEPADKKQRLDQHNWNQDNVNQDDWKQAWILAEEGEPIREASKDQECPICEEVNTNHVDGNGMRMCCAKCGFVFENISDDRPDFGGKQEAGSYTAEPSRAETINPLMPHASMSTDIAYSGRLAYRQYQMVKLNRWSSLSPVERSLYIVFNKIEKASAKHHVPSGVQYSAKWLFKRVYECNIEKHAHGQKREGLRGTKRDGLIAACLYMAFKSMGLYWTKTRVAMVFEIEIGEIRRGLAIFSELVKDQPDLLAKITGCKQYITWFSVGLGCSRSVSTLCCKLFKSLSSRGVGSSKQPQSVAAGCLWAICQELCPDITMDKMVHVTGISKATIRDVLRSMGGVERFCMMSVFADDMCDQLEIMNPLTRNKVQRICKALFSIIDEIPAPSGPRTSFYWLLACYAIYFVLVVNKTTFNEARFLQQCNVPHSFVLYLAKYTVFYRDSLIELIAN